MARAGVHADLGVRIRLTMLTALYQFVVLGVQLYFPLGFAALVAASIWFARQRR